MSQLEAGADGAGAQLAALAGSVGIELAVETPPKEPCPHLALARSGVLWLTRAPDGPPAVCGLPLIASTAALCAAIAALSAERGAVVELDEGRVLVERAAERGFGPGGATSANGSCRLLPCADGWLTCNLPRPDDPALLAAALGWEDQPSDPWGALAEEAQRGGARDLAARLALVGLAASVLGESTGDEPLGLRRLGARAPVGRPRIVDLSAMWAGPLCAHVLGRAGADVVSVEDPSRPDGSRIGDPSMHERLHRGHRRVACSFSTEAGRRDLRRLVATADVVIESSRPRALGAIGLGPEAFLAGRPGRVWISITGYGRTGERSSRAAFGDDAAAAGGLVAWSGAAPVFLADAVADPLSGLLAAFGGLVALRAGGGIHVDVSMSGSAAFAGRGARCAAAHAVRRSDDGRWVATHDGASAVVRSPAEAIGGG